MKLEQTLQDIGFPASEAKVYLALLELGKARASEISKKTRIKRPSVYVLLKSLMHGGHVGSYKKRGITYFTAQNPKTVIDLANERAKTAKQALPMLEALIRPESGALPQVQYFEGKQGMISMMEDTLLVPNKTILVWADISLAWDTLKDYYPIYIRKKNERKIFVQGILVNNETGQMFQKKGKVEQRSVRLIPKDQFPMSNEINIYEDKVNIISHKDQMGVIIQNQEIADTQRSIFKLGWLAAETLDNTSKS